MQPYKLPAALSSGGIFSIKVLSSQMIIVCQVDIKLASTHINTRPHSKNLSHKNKKESQEGEARTSL